MLQVRKDNIGLKQGFHMTFKNGYTISVQFGSGNHCSNSLIPIETDREKKTFGKCMNCETAIFKQKGKFLKYKGEEFQGWQTTKEVAEIMHTFKHLKLITMGG